MELRRYARQGKQPASVHDSGHAFSRACRHLRHLDLKAAIDCLLGLGPHGDGRNDMIQSETEMILSRIKEARKGSAESFSDYTLGTYTWHP